LLISLQTTTRKIQTFVAKVNCRRRKSLKLATSYMVFSLGSDLST
jgi:hypothetical protein